MGLISWFKNLYVKRPPEGTTPRTPQEVYQALLGLNDPEALYYFRDGGQEGVDIVAEWKLAIDNWRYLFGGVKYFTQTWIRLHPELREVRTIDKQWAISWTGTDSFNFVSGKARNQGQINTREKTWKLTRGEDGKRHFEFDRWFSSAELKDPMRTAIITSGWTWRGVNLARNL